MNSKPFFKKYFLPLALIACFSVVLIAWGHKQQSPQQTGVGQPVNDTIPKVKTDRKIRNLDDALDDLDRADMKIDMDKVNAEIEQAMKSVDMGKIKMEIDKAMKDVDMSKIKDEIDKAMKDVDMNKIKAEVDRASKEIDAAEIERQVKESLSKIDMEKINEQIKEQMAELKDVDMSKLDADMKKLEIEMKDLKPRIDKELGKAKENIEKAKTEMKEYKSFIDGLDRDGLINKNGEYTIEHKNSTLVINGKQQPSEVYEKYRSFLDKNKKFTIRKSADDFNIDNNDD